MSENIKGASVSTLARKNVTQKSSLSIRSIKRKAQALDAKTLNLSKKSLLKNVSASIGLRSSSAKRENCTFVSVSSNHAKKVAANFNVNAQANANTCAHFATKAHEALNQNAHASANASANASSSVSASTSVNTAAGVGSSANAAVKDAGSAKAMVRSPKAIMEKATVALNEVKQNAVSVSQKTKTHVQDGVKVALRSANAAVKTAGAAMREADATVRGAGETHILSSEMVVRNAGSAVTTANLEAKEKPYATSTETASHFVSEKTLESNNTHNTDDALSSLDASVKAQAKSVVANALDQALVGNATAHNANIGSANSAHASHAAQLSKSQVVAASSVSSSVEASVNATSLASEASAMASVATMNDANSVAGTASHTGVSSGAEAATRLKHPAVLVNDQVSKVMPLRSWSEQIKAALVLFLPIFIGQLAATSMGVMDTVMTGAAGTLQLSGVAIGSSIFWPAELFVVGMALSIHPIISNLVGAKNLSLVSERMQVATIVCVLFGAIVGAIIMLVPFAYRLIPGIDMEMLSIGHGYLVAVGIAMPGFAIFNVLRSYWEGLGRSFPTLMFGLLVLAINIPFNYVLIFGKFGFPALGGVGSGIATMIAIYLTVICMLIYIQKSVHFKEARIFRTFHKVPFSEYVKFAKFALPLGCAGMIETLCFSLVSVLLSPFGPVVVASHTIAMNVSGLLVIVPLALSSTASVHVGEAMGGRNLMQAKRVALCASYLALSFFVIALITLVGGKDIITALYSSDEAVRALAPVLMMFCAVYLLPDTMQLIGVGILRGFKDSRSIFIITIIAYWVIGMPVGFLLGYGYVSDHFVGAQGFWIGFICSLSAAAIMLFLRVGYLFKQKAKEHKLQEAATKEKAPALNALSA